jgi:dienelactone hydrolase
MNKLILIIILVSSFIFQDCTSKQNDKTAASNKEPVKQVKLEVQKDEITINTADSKHISASYFYEKAQKESLQPLIVLIHQFNQSKEQWKSDFIDSLCGNGFKVLAYDIRGHGSSSKVSYDLTKLLSDPNEAPADIDAVFSWAKKEKGIDSSRIGTMGTSIGGNLAVYARLKLGAKTAVSISGSKDGFEAFTGYDERMMNKMFPRISSVFLICGSKDGQHEQDAKFIMENFLDAPKDLKVYDSDKHGMFLIEEKPEINSLAINWFKKYL